VGSSSSDQEVEVSRSFKSGEEIKVRDKFVPTKSRRSATVIEDRGEAGVLVWVHWRAARGGSWQSRQELVARSRII
jgi:hypothetical protein